LPTTPLVKHSPLTSQWIGRIQVREETDYRATVIVMALNAWKAEHGELPDRLEQLVGSELDRLPLDPLFALPFQYYPRGTPTDEKGGHAPVWTTLQSEPRAATSRVVYGDPAGRRRMVSDEPVVWTALCWKEDQQSVDRLPPKSGAAQADFPYGLVARGGVQPATVKQVIYGGTAYPILQMVEGKR
jgi:hypothetical protein